MDATEDYIRALPKTETHLHLEGALPWELLCQTLPEKYSTPPASWARDFRFRDFAHFEGELLSYACDFFTSAERYHACAKAVFADRLARNVRYMECSFASGCVEFLNLDGKEVLAAIREAVPEGLQVRVFMGIHHSGYSEKMAPVIEEALVWEDLAGIDMHGPEDEPLGDWAVGLWARAREAGKFTKAHAGEFLGADFVDFAIESLGAQRIEHGHRAIENDAVVSKLRDRGIALDMCPISNIKLGVAADAWAHAIRALTDAGVCCTLSTDDPISFGNVLEDEYRLLNEEGGFSLSELAELARNGFRVALTDEAQRTAWLSEVDAFVQGRE